MAEIKIIIPFHISLTFIKSHPELIFVYGNDYYEKGCFGQAWACQREPNTFSVPTLLKICLSQSDRWFDDGNYNDITKMIDEKISHIPLDGRPIIPFRKIGEGHSEMKRRAPKSWQYLMYKLDEIKYKNFEVDYKGLTYPLYSNFGT